MTETLQALDGASSVGRQQLLRLGYDPHPVVGKKALCEGWREPRTDKQLAEFEQKFPNATGTGVTTGHLAVVDVDVVEDALAERIMEFVENSLGPNPYQRVGAKGVQICYQNSNIPISKIAIKGIAPGETEPGMIIETLGEGQQIVAYGIHPDTGKPYKWLNAADGKELLKTPLEELPTMPPEALYELAETLAQQLLPELGFTEISVSGISKKSTSEGGAGSNSNGAPVTQKMLVDMLTHIDPGCDRTQWIKIGGALKRTNVVDPGTGEPDPEFDPNSLFCRWSSGKLNREHEPANYKDGEDCEKAFSSLRPDRKRSAGTGSIVRVAKLGGYEGPTQWKSGPATVEQKLEEMNVRFAVMTEGSNTGHIVDLSNPSKPHFLKPQDFKLLFRNQKVTCKDGKPKPASELWLEGENRREITDIVFEPDGSRFAIPFGAHNLWRGHAIDPQKGNAHLPLLNHILVNVCQWNEEHYVWILTWLADLVQRPGDKSGAAVALKGPQGSGKSILCAYLSTIFGVYALKVSHQRHVTGNFNSQLYGKCLLCVEEGFWAGDKKAEGVLKDLITADDIIVEQKFFDPISIHNHVHMIVTSNENWVVPAGLRERRWTVLDVNSDYTLEDWVPIWANLKDGSGPSCLLQFLLSYDYDGNILKRPLSSTARANQIIAGLSPYNKWWFEILSGEREVAPNSEGDDIFEAEIRKDQIYEDFCTWGDQSKIGTRREGGQFWKQMKENSGGKLKITRPSSDPGRKRHVVFPSRRACQEIFAKKAGCEFAELFPED